MADGRAALGTQRYDIAIQAFDTAPRLYPGDHHSAALLERARAGRERLSAYRRHIHEAHKFIQAGQYAAAMRELDTAQKMYPNDRHVIALQDYVRGREQRLTVYRHDIQVGAEAQKLRRYDDAITHYQAALRLFPGDKNAQALIEGVQRAKAAATQKRVAYDRAMAEAGTAMQQKRYEQAIAHYKEALRLDATSAQAKSGLQQAENPKAQQQQQPQAEEARRRQQQQQAYANYMKQGQAAMQNKLYAQAVKFYQEAVNLFPNDATARNALLQAKASCRC